MSEETITKPNGPTYRAPRMITADHIHSAAVALKGLIDDALRELVEHGEPGSAVDHLIAVSRGAGLLAVQLGQTGLDGCDWGDARTAERDVMEAVGLAGKQDIAPRGTCVDPAVQS